MIVTGTVADGELEPPLPPAELLPAVPLPAVPLDDDDELVLWATGLTSVIRPSTLLPSGISTVTGSWTTASDCIVASRSTVTTSLVEVVWRIGWALALAALATPEPVDDPPPDPLEPPEDEPPEPPEPLLKPADPPEPPEREPDPAVAALAEPPLAKPPPPSRPLPAWAVVVPPARPPEVGAEDKPPAVWEC